MAPALPIIFMHGWAFDPTVWEQTRAALGPMETRCLDFGFFSPRADLDLPARPYVGVGHSLGALWLLRHHGPHCRGLLLINGFSRFGAGPDFADGISPRIIARMRTGLRHAPEGMLRTFRQRAGINTPVPPHIACDRLEQGLAALMDMDCRPDLRHAPCPVHVMAGTHDAIAPPGLTRACFPPHGPVLTRWLDAGHLLPLTHAADCARAITDLTRRIPPP
ncbi:alpha/beta hydrolase [Komagataeibacter rhaeticus]|uniref:alpha/beta fold hydrolase n=1 Tax=Komagataeibacter rhaeticus TaxID=215221 RepID=UPI0004DA905A|nr:alpha/beta hydrolase [Komagataeibacter rhaeticus]KDU94605.1 hypothetical protein GLUCORHAEAF1_12930 [Komagataeibacter rhaeticus AF1]MBL7238608.1 alpha/beta hydrolase [Komagataeibacter rhaeticus]PYD53641.1 alpha/beta hydrolase [Komagataeibacter rhaeticus]GBQ11071.1 hypothetical protein AA16663_0726 [Komagataeibacter rhaeticus DSM 16663]